MNPAAAAPAIQKNYGEDEFVLEIDAAGDIPLSSPSPTFSPSAERIEDEDL